MGALLSLPLLALPSVGTVSDDSIAGSLFTADAYSYGQSQPHVVELRLAQQYVAHAESFKIGRPRFLDLRSL
jgi:carbohydrate-selective porin OprB